jgi:hypothetical protein
MVFSQSSLRRFMTAAQVGLPVILVTGSRGRAKVVEVAVIAMLEVPLATRFCVLCRLCRAWQGSYGEKNDRGRKSVLLRFFASQAHRSLPRQQNDRNAVANAF